MLMGVGDTGVASDDVAVDEAGHAVNANLSRELIRATKRFAVDPGAMAWTMSLVRGPKIGPELAGGHAA